MPALSHMELCLLLTAIALKVNTASIKATKVNKVRWMEFSLEVLAKQHLVMFLRREHTCIHGLKSIMTELLV